jgi:hypothetical protein
MVDRKLMRYGTFGQSVVHMSSLWVPLQGAWAIDNDEYSHMNRKVYRASHDHAPPHIAQDLLITTLELIGLSLVISF